MKTISRSVLLSVLFSMLCIFQTNAQDAKTILAKMDDVIFAPKDQIAKNKIVLIDKNGKQDVRTADLKQKGTERRIMRFTSPSSQAGIAVLSLPNNVMYLYLPAFGKERRISSSVKNQNFAGTDFSYDDMESKSYSNKYTPKFIKSEGDLYVLELVPKGRSQYSKIVAKINKTHYYPVMMDFYDRGNKKIKSTKHTFKKSGKYWYASEIKMTDLKKNHVTKMQMLNVSFDTGISDDEFTIRKLKQ